MEKKTTTVLHKPIFYACSGLEPLWELEKQLASFNFKVRPLALPTTVLVDNPKSNPHSEERSLERETSILKFLEERHPEADAAFVLKSFSDCTYFEHTIIPLAILIDGDKK